MDKVKRNSLVIVLVILLISFITVFAQDVIIQQGDVDAAEGTGEFKELVVDTDVLVVDETNDRVGIGTTSPSQLLEVSKSVSGAARMAGFFNPHASGTYAEIYIGKQQASDDTLVMGYNISDNYGYIQLYGDAPGDSLVIADGGNVGIGTTSPSEKLDVNGNANVDGTLTVDELVLPVKTTTGDPASPVEGQIYVNTQDNKVRVYADGSWRDLSTW